ncbi:hypothetical protein U2F10_11205 [Leptothoe sp. EHU-05/26/07-4]
MDTLVGWASPTNISARVATLGYKRASRSQYSGTITGYDADQGIAMVGIPTGGTVYAKSITISAQQSVAVSLPLLLPTDSTDVKPVL